MTSTNTSELLTQLTQTAAAVRGRGWASPELGGGMPGLGNLAGGADPVAGLSQAGLGWFAPFVSFLSQPSAVLQGNPGTVTSGSTGFAQGAQTVSGLANQYQQASSTQTQGWSGDAASSYQGTSSQVIDSISSLAESAYSMSDAIAGAGEVVGQAIDIITQLGTQAISEIVPIMSQAVAAAPLTGGQSIAAAIPQCVAIATNYGQQMLAKLGALLASGQNLLKLVKGALAVVQLVTKALKEIGQQSNGGGTTDPSQGGGAQQSSNQKVDTPTANGDPSADGGSATDGTGSGAGTGNTSGVTSQSLSGTDPSAGSYTGAGTNATTTPSFAPRTTTSPSSSYGGGGMPMGAMAGGAAGGSRDSETSSSRRTPGALTGAFEADDKDMTVGNDKSKSEKSTARSAGTSGMPMGAGRGAGGRSEDKEHKSRVRVEEDPEVFDGDDDQVVIALPVIGEVTAR